MRNRDLKPGVKVQVCVADEKPRLATVVRRVTNTLRSSVYEVKYRNGHVDHINQCWLKKGWDEPQKKYELDKAQVEIITDLVDCSIDSLDVEDYEEAKLFISVLRALGKNKDADLWEEAFE